jgi:hypothetical protein
MSALGMKWLASKNIGAIVFGPIGCRIIQDGVAGSETDQTASARITRAWTSPTEPTT